MARRRHRQSGRVSKENIFTTHVNFFLYGLRKSNANTVPIQGCSFVALAYTTVAHTAVCTLFAPVVITTIIPS